MTYLTNLPQSIDEFGLCKTLAVRREVIHIKHILTEIFVRKTINIEKLLTTIHLSLFDYIAILTNVMRKVHKYSREYINNPNDIVKLS